MVRASFFAALKTTQTPPPARPTREGRVVVIASAMAAAASPARPPCRMMSRPIEAARGSSATTWLCTGAFVLYLVLTQPGSSAAVMAIAPNPCQIRRVE